MDNLDWSVAGLRCKSLHPDAHLVMITSAAEQQAIKTWMSTYTGMHTLVLNQISAIFGLYSPESWVHSSP